jgi:hypothetical protein
VSPAPARRTVRGELHSDDVGCDACRTSIATTVVGSGPPLLLLHGFRRRRQAHGICDEYRAGAGIDRDHDAIDQAAGRRISCPTLALWGKGGGRDEWYVDEGVRWRYGAPGAQDVRGEAVDGGHFFPEVHPVRTAARLKAFCTEGA